MGLHDKGKRVGGAAGETKGGVEDVFDTRTNGCINGVLLNLWAKLARNFVFFIIVVTYLGAVLVFDTRVRDEVEATRPIESMVKSF
jgi:hypothetical protein